VQVHRDPLAAEQAAIAALSEVDVAGDHAHASWVLGLALRESGRGAEAADTLELALAAAFRLADSELAARIATSLAHSIVSRGELERARTLLSDHEHHVTGLARGNLVMQRAVVHHRLFELDQAAADYESALEEFILTDDKSAQARLRIDLGLLEIQRGDFPAARAQLSSAVAACSRSGQRAIEAVALHNLGYLEFTLDHVPQALALFAQADEAYADVSNSDGIALVAVDRAVALSSAGLTGEAADAIGVAVGLIDAAGNRADLADTLVRAASLSAAAGRHVDAVAAATRAHHLYEEQQRANMLSLVDLLRLEINGAFTPERLDRALGLAERFAKTPSERDRALIVALECANELDERVSAAEIAQRLANRRRRLSTMIRIRLDVERAKLAEAAGDRASARRLVGRALNEVRRDNALIGAIELRAHVSARGIELARMAASHAIDRRSPRELLRRLEAMHGFATVITRRDDATSRESESLLAELRQVTDQMRSIAPFDGAARQLDLRRSELESAVRERSHRRVGLQSDATSIAEMIARLGDRELVEFGSVDDEMWSVRVRSRRATMHRIGTVRDLEEVIEGIGFALNRLNRSRGSEASRAAAATTVVELATGLDRQLFGNMRLSDRPLVIVPSAEMNGLAWRALPSLIGRRFTLSPSFEIWAATSRRTDSNASCLLVAGANLDGADPEIERLSQLRSAATTLTESDATVQTTLSVLSEVDLAHLACHGTYRADNPLFSSLLLADGALTVYDLERCPRLPSTVILSSCNVGQAVLVGGGALLGMASALLQLGVSSVIAPLTPVNDERSVDLMVRLHTHLAAGVPAAEALAKASIGPDGELDPTAAPFICFGS